MAGRVLCLLHIPDLGVQGGDNAVHLVEFFRDGCLDTVNGALHVADSLDELGVCQAIRDAPLLPLPAGLESTFFVRTSLAVGTVPVNVTVDRWSTLAFYGCLWRSRWTSLAVPFAILRLIS